MTTETDILATQPTIAAPWQILDSLQDPIIATALDDTICYWNRGAEKLYGYSAREVTGVNVLELTADSCRQTVLEHLAVSKAGTPGKRFSTTHVCRDGHEMQVWHLIAPHYDANGQLLGAVSSIQELSTNPPAESELLAVNQQLTQSVNALTASNNDLQKFAYIASHDLQAPLRHISGFVQLLQTSYSDKIDAQATDWIDRTIQSTHKMQALIKDLLSFSRLDSMPAERIPVDMSSMVEDAMQSLSSEIADAAATVQSGELPIVIGDPVLLTQLMTNLLCNAIKFRAKQTPDIRITCVEQNGEYIFSVADNGIGIDAEQFEKIFVIFQRLHSHCDHPGRGMGLALSRRIVSLHAGHLWVESTPGEGSTFRFSIPICPPGNSL